MTKLSLSQQHLKLSEALAVAKLAEEKASQMSELATAIAEKYQQRLYKSVQGRSQSSE